jgi:hypothetical protein
MPADDMVGSKSTEASSIRNATNDKDATNSRDATDERDATNSRDASNGRDTTTNSGEPRQILSIIRPILNSMLNIAVSHAENADGPTGKIILARSARYKLQPFVFVFVFLLL